MPHIRRAHCETKATRASTGARAPKARLNNSEGGKDAFMPRMTAGLARASLQSALGAANRSVDAQSHLGGRARRYASFSAEFVVKG